MKILIWTVMNNSFCVDVDINLHFTSDCFFIDMHFIDCIEKIPN